MRPGPLPPELVDGPFSTATARAAGVPAARLRRSDLTHPTRGVHVIGDLPDGLAERARAVGTGLGPDAAFSHVTAALLWRLPLPGDVERRPGLDVITRSDSGQVVRTGCRGHRGLESRDVLDLRGVRTVAPADTWCDLGDLGRRRLTVEDLVVAGDAALTRIDELLGLTRLESRGRTVLQETLAGRVRPRGAVALRAALALVRPGVRSAQETRTRLLFVGAGLPEPEVNVPITDELGEFLGEGDLVWRREKVVAEYQGSDHADRERRSEDSFRRELATESDWTVHEVWAEDLVRPARRHALIRRVARSLASD